MKLIYHPCLTKNLYSKCGHFNIIESCKDCQKIQRQWYKKLKGFDDIEDQRLRLLKKWTGVPFVIEEENFIINILDQIQSQSPDTPVQSSWPEAYFVKEEEFLNHPDFESICENILKHGNNVITTKTMVKIWQSHCEGASLREIEKLYKIPNATVYRAIKKLREMISLMDLDKNEVVIVRDHNPSKDDPLIFSTWRNSVWFDVHREEKIDPAFFRIKTKEIKTTLLSPNTQVKVACSKENPDHIIGYAILDNKTIEFVYIKIDYRGQGIATLLTKGFATVATPCTKIGSAIVKNHGLKTKENNYAQEETREAQV